MEDLDLAQRWQEAFLQVLRPLENSGPLKEAALNSNLGAWTEALTGLVVQSCESMGWEAAALGHPCQALPVTRNEYLSLDVMAFDASGGGSGSRPGDKIDSIPGSRNDRRGGRWRFPMAAMELENSRSDDLVAYSLWKTLCARSDLRVVFCYRQSDQEGASLVRLPGRRHRIDEPGGEDRSEGRDPGCGGHKRETFGLPLWLLQMVAARSSIGNFRNLLKQIFKLFSVDARLF